MHENITHIKDKYNYLLFAYNDSLCSHENHDTACSAYVDARRLENAGFKVKIIKLNATAHSENVVGLYVYSISMNQLRSAVQQEINELDKKDEVVS
jgi:hypothetical protein